MTELLTDAARRSAAYLASLNGRPVAPTADAIANLERFDELLPDQGTDPTQVLEMLDRLGSPATVATAGPRYFGFVIGGAYPATLAANWLAGAWDQNAGFFTGSPTGAVVEYVAEKWLVDLLGLPAGTAAGFVTGATMANFTALGAARHAVLARTGWDAEARGLFGAPEIRVIVGDEVHISVLKALGLLGLGRERLDRVPTDEQGRMRSAAFPALDDRPTIICLQAGNVNTGAFDPVVRADLVSARNAWVHVDGAFGLWAAAAPARAHLMAGYDQADSWATDAHKWLNVPYDCGIVFVRDRAPLRAAMSATAAYLMKDEGVRDNDDFTPELSRRARGVEVWAALRFLGRSGLGELVERCCRLAQRFADGLKAGGCEILNDVVLNQVLVRFGDDARTRAVITRIQEDGTCWAGGTTWHGKAAMRISVSSWQTTEADVDLSIAAMLKAASQPM
jgi:glutamate/tyrosine decarboxylase-like PLP-dependent enzyme